MSEDNRPDYEGIYRATYADFVARGQEIAAKDAELAALREEIKACDARAARFDEQREAAEAECQEQARLNGMGAERELALKTKLEAAEELNKRYREALESKHYACENCGWVNERPVKDCGHVGGDGCCTHPKNMTPECHAFACPLLTPDASGGAR